MKTRSKEFHELNFACKRVIEFVERNPDGVDPELRMSDDNIARADFLVKTGWLTTKNVGCQSDKVRYIRTDKQ